MEKATIIGMLLHDETAAKVVALYCDPGDGFPQGTMIINVFLPRPRFEVIGALIQNAMNTGNTKLSMNFGFDGFRQTPSNWSEIPIPTEAQFFGNAMPALTIAAPRSAPSARQSATVRHCLSLKSASLV